MPYANFPFDGPRLHFENDRPFISLPWTRADEIHQRVRDRGLAATLCLEPARRAARLEVWPGTDPARALAAVEELCASAPAARA